MGQRVSGCKAMCIAVLHRAETDQLSTRRPGLVAGFAQPAGPLDFGNSGTGCRLVMGAVAGCPVTALFDGDASQVAALEQKIVAHLGMPAVWTNVGQVYPRSLDWDVVTALVQPAFPFASTKRTSTPFAT